MNTLRKYKINKKIGSKCMDQVKVHKDCMVLRKENTKEI